MRIDAADLDYMIRNMTAADAFALGVTFATMNAAKPTPLHVNGDYRDGAQVVMVPASEYARIVEQAKKWKLLNGDEDPRDLEWQSEVRANRLVGAIKAYRQLYGAGLKDARDAVELWRDQNRKTP